MAPRICSLQAWGWTPASGRRLGRILDRWLSGADNSARAEDWLERKIWRESISLTRASIVVDGDEALGVALVGTPEQASFRASAVGTPHLSLLCVAPDHRRQGWSRRLIDRSLADLSPAEHLHALAQPELTGYYQNLGFHAVDTRSTLGLAHGDSRTSDSARLILWSTHSSPSDAGKIQLNLCASPVGLFERSPSERQRRLAIELPRSEPSDPAVRLHLEATLEGQALAIHHLQILGGSTTSTITSTTAWQALATRVHRALTQLPGSHRQILLVGCQDSQPLTLALRSCGWASLQQFDILRCAQSSGPRR